MQAYKKYKDSGIDWLGKIPEHWKIVKMKYFNHIYNGDSLNEAQKDKYESEDLNLLAYLSTKDIDLTFSRINYVNELRIPINAPFKVAPENSSLICIEGGSAGKKIAFTNQKVYFVNKLACFNTNEGTRSKFIYYTLKGAVFQTQFSIAMTGLIGGVSMSSLNNFLFTLPSLNEQESIATFLDDKCTKIDEAVGIKESQIEKLREFRQITIHEAVTKGLDKQVKMKDSGIDWIGEIPDHWEVKANRVLFSERNESGNDDLPLLSVSLHSGVSKEELPEEGNIRGRIKIEDKSSYKLVQVDDIVFNMMRAWQGAIGSVRIKGMVSPAYIVACPKLNFNSDYIEYQFRTNVYIQEMGKSSKGITDFRKRLYWNEFKQLLTIIPPLPEQKQIVAFLENQTSKIDKAIDLKEKQIAQLKEYKQSLINELVTGKICVPQLTIMQ